MRKLTLLTGSLLLALLAWTPSLRGSGPCSCLYCKENPLGACMIDFSTLQLCRDYYTENCLS